MTVNGALLILCVVGVGLSLVSIAVVFVLGIEAGIHTVIGASRRARRRAESVGELAEAFPIWTLIGIDEDLERAALDAEDSAPK